METQPVWNRNAKIGMEWQLWNRNAKIGTEWRYGIEMLR